MVQNRHIRQFLDAGRRLIRDMVQIGVSGSFLDAGLRLIGDIVKVGRIVIKNFAIDSYLKYIMY